MVNMCVKFEDCSFNSMDVMDNAYAAGPDTVRCWQYLDFFTEKKHQSLKVENGELAKW